jgi:hypothetical protein
MAMGVNESMPPSDSLNCTINIIRLYICLRIVLNGGHVARIGERRGVYRVLVGKLEGK